MSRASQETAVPADQNEDPYVARQRSMNDFFGKSVNGSHLPYAMAGHQERHAITSGGLRKERLKLIKQFLFMVTSITLVLWIAMPIFFGSLYLTLPYIPNLRIRIVDLDSAASGSAAIVGPAFQALASQSNSLPRSTPHLGFDVMDATNYPNGVYDAIDEVLSQDCWASIVIHSNATSVWRDALEGNTTAAASYDPSGSVGIYYMGARFYQVVLIFLRPFLLKDAHEALTTASQTALSTLLTSLNSTYTPSSDYPASSVALTTAPSLAALASTPALVSSPFGMYTYDLRPVTAWGAAAIFEAADIYFLIFCFPLTLWLAIARSVTGIGRNLKLRSLYMLRLGTCIVVYFFMSLWVSCVVAAFQIPFDTTIGRAGFVVFWMLTWMFLLALGLAFETMISLLTIRFIPFFLIFWIILNITSSFYPPELTELFYHWFIAFPFYNHVDASKIIFFGTDHAHVLGRRFGALIGAAAVNFICLGLATWFERWRDERGERKAQEKEAKEEKAEKDRVGGEEGN